MLYCCLRYTKNDLKNGHKTLTDTHQIRYKNVKQAYKKILHVMYHSGNLNKNYNEIPLHTY